MAHRLRSWLRKRSASTAVPSPCPGHAGRSRDSTPGELKLDVRQLYESPRVPGRSQRNPLESPSHADPSAHLRSASEEVPLNINWNNENRTNCPQAASEDRLDSQTCGCRHSTDDPTANSCEDDNENFRVSESPPSYHRPGRVASAERTMLEFPHLFSLENFFRDTENSNATKTPLNLFDCDRLVPTSRRSQYPLALEIDYNRTSTSAPSTQPQHLLPATHFTRSAQQIPPCITLERSEDSRSCLDRSQRSQSMDIRTCEHTSRTIEDRQRNPSYHSTAFLHHEFPIPERSKILQLPPSPHGTLLPNLNEQLALQDGSSSAVYESNASLVSSLLRQDSSVPWFDEQSPPPYSDLPPPSYFEATLNDLLKKQKTIIRRKKQITFNDL